MILFFFCLFVCLFKVFYFSSKIFRRLFFYSNSSDDCGGCDDYDADGDDGGQKWKRPF